jgi:proprotein convertase subtilisin/kexin type 5
MAYFFMAKRECASSTPIYSLVDFQCYTTTTCPAGSALSVADNVCVSCHYTCLTCTGPLDTECKTCDSAAGVAPFRDPVFPVTGGKCPCQAGYYENAANKVCATCISKYSLCGTCDQNDCLTCSQSMFINITATNNQGCRCPDNFYYVPASDVCAPFHGCTSANKNPDFVNCITCDTSLFFKQPSAPITTPCQCQDNYNISGAACVDICGDGINPYLNSTTYCDDGDRDDLDGCNLNCSV